MKVDFAPVAGALEAHIVARVLHSIEEEKNSPNDQEVRRLANLAKETGYELDSVIEHFNASVNEAIDEAGRPTT